MVTYSYKLTREGATYDHQFIRVRKDLDWQQVLHTHIQDLSLNGTFTFPT